MNRKSSVFSILCVIILAVFSAFMSWYVVSMSSTAGRIADTRQSLETSRGRENKQQSEYDKAVRDLPAAQAELMEKQPLAEAAEKQVAELKERRNSLRREKQELENQSAVPAASEEGTSNE